ncbi:MAG TPA: periplasmic heavy metal sensor [Polyangia bacterium]|jgi:periplasmic protein CpxP/Spy|nr:periplasmic heavy metal sensor [Polyangia bacterium]
MTEGQFTNLHQPKSRRWWLLLALPVALAGVFGARAWAFGGPGMGGMGFGPGGFDGEGGPAEHQAFMQRRLEKALDLVKATDSQRAAIKPIIQKLAADMKPIHQQHAQLHKAIVDAFAAATLDPAAIENLRAQASALMDQASKTITTALVEAGNILTADQRQILVQHMRSHGGGHRRHGS